MLIETVYFTPQNKYANIKGSDLANGTLAVFFFPREWIMRYE